MTVTLTMVAMMVPGVLPATVRNARSKRNPRSAASFIGTYLAIWALVAVAVQAVYRQPTTAVTAALVIAAGVYELSPIKQRFRQRCRSTVHSSLEFGLCCVGSSIGLMLVLVAVNLMSVPWMVVVAAVVAAQKVLREKTAVDVSLGLAIVALGILIAIEPSLVPGLHHQSM